MNMSSYVNDRRSDEVDAAQGRCVRLILTALEAVIGPIPENLKSSIFRTIGEYTRILLEMKDE